MTRYPLKPAALALALGIAVAGLASAQTAPTPAQKKELDAARAEMERAAARLAELSAKYGAAGGPIHIERRVLRKPVIGVVLAPDDGAGVRIAAVTPDSAAADAGLRSGDRLVSIDGKAIDAGTGSARVEQTRDWLAKLDAKSPVRLGYVRDGKTQSVAVVPKVADRLLFVPGMDGEPGLGGELEVFDLGGGQVEVIARRAARDAGAARLEAREVEQIARRAAVDAGRHAQWSAAIAPDVRREVIRLGGDCKGDDCKLPVLAEALRWNGLNLASVDAGLGRYFGTSSGVLVLSTSKDLEGLQSGDVITRIDGTPVNSPREAMDALRAQPAEGKVRVDYLRDRASGSTTITVPKALPLRVPAPPAIPHLPGTTSSVLPPAPGMRKVVIVDKDGKIQQWEGKAGETPPAWVAKLAPADGPGHGDGKRTRKVVIIDKDGKRREWEDDGSAPLPPLPEGARKVEERVMVFTDANGVRRVVAGPDGVALPPPPPPPPAAPGAPPPPPPPPPDLR